ncbi:MAG TPA: hypothetical protein VGR28_11920 [Candidatus Thermoplasmatota archaeon]|jgi:hypothetical protein|nr:hypothetical protein [Candidatus Thermoplasmatota archaeon]
MAEGKIAVLALLGVLVAGCTAPAQPLPAVDPAPATEPAEPAEADTTMSASAEPASGDAPPPACPDPLGWLAKRFDLERVNVSAEDLAAPPDTPPLGVPITSWRWCAKALPPMFTAHFAFDLPEETTCEFSAVGATRTTGVTLGMVGMQGDTIENFGFAGGGMIVGAHAAVADTDMVADALVQAFAGDRVGAGAFGGSQTWAPGVHTVTLVFPHAEAGQNDISGDQAAGWYLACEEPFVLTTVEGSTEALLLNMDSAKGGVGAHAGFSGINAADEARGTFASPSVMAWGFGFGALGVVDVQHTGGTASWTFQPDGFQKQAEVAAPGDVVLRLTGVHPTFGDIYLMAAGHAPIESLEALGAVHG